MRKLESSAVKVIAGMLRRLVSGDRDVSKKRVNLENFISGKGSKAAVRDVP